MTDIIIPPEAVEAAAKADYEMTRDEALADHGIMASSTYCPWEDLSVDGKEYYMKHATAALRAALAAWPGMWHIKPIDFEGKIILPLPQEKK